MKAVLLIIPVYLIIGFIEIYTLYKRNQKREIGLYVFLITLAFIISILLIAGMNLPKPMDIIEKLFPHLKSGI